MYCSFIALFFWGRKDTTRNSQNAQAYLYGNKTKAAAIYTRVYGFPRTRRRIYVLLALCLFRVNGPILAGWSIAWSFIVAEGKPFDGPGRILPSFLRVVVMSTPDETRPDWKTFTGIFGGDCITRFSWREQTTTEFRQTHPLPAGGSVLLGAEEYFTQQKLVPLPPSHTPPSGDYKNAVVSVGCLFYGVRTTGGKDKIVIIFGNVRRSYELTHTDRKKKGVVTAGGWRGGLGRLRTYKWEILHKRQ